MRLESSRFLFVLGVTVLGAVTVSCASTTTPVAGTADSGVTPDVTVTTPSNTFSPAAITIKPGQTVRWTVTAGSHNVVSGTSCTPDGMFSSGDPRGAPFTFDHTFPAAGTFKYYCDPHCALGMVGTVTVAP